MLPIELDPIRILRQILSAQIHDDLAIDARIERGVVASAPWCHLQGQIERGPAPAAAHDESARVIPSRIGFVELARGNGAAPGAVPAIDWVGEQTDREALDVGHQVLADEPAGVGESIGVPR